VTFKTLIVLILADFYVFKLSIATNYW